MLVIYKIIQGCYTDLYSMQYYPILSIASPFLSPPRTRLVDSTPGVLQTPPPNPKPILGDEGSKIWGMHLENAETLERYNDYDVF